MKRLAPVVAAVNNDILVTLLDIPASIEFSQQSDLILRAADPPACPFQSTEPKGVKLQRVREGIPPSQLDYDSELELTLQASLALLKDRITLYGSIWCFNRVLRSVNSELVLQGRQKRAEVSSIPVILAPLENCFSHNDDIRDTVVVNLSDVKTEVHVNSAVYFVPPRSTFIWGTLERCLSTCRQHCPNFDLIVSDPPWPNRSVRRSKAYKTSDDQLKDPFTEVLKIVHSYLLPDGLFAIWISNKLAVRNEVMEEMRALGLNFQAEWTWLKITTMGEPVLPLNGVWRKPYEVLLIFSRVTKPLRKLHLVAVPDVHSRKPSLKQLLEPFLPPKYQALELFARSLTAGWWSWGDEVLKFQDSREWVVQDAL